MSQKAWRQILVGYTVNNWCSVLVNIQEVNGNKISSENISLHASLVVKFQAEYRAFDDTC